MNKKILTGICIGLSIACQSEEQIPVQVGKLTSVSNNSSYLEIEKISTVGDFNLIYQEKSRDDGSFQLILPYDFDKKEIETHDRAKTGISIIGIPFECLINCCLYSDVSIEVAPNQTHQIESEPLNKTSLKKWISLQILNNGQDPTLSDSPQDAVFRLAFDKEQPLSDANLLLYQIVEAYEEFLEERESVEQLDIKQLKEKYPLNLRFAVKDTPVPILPTDCGEEIFEEIILDLNE
ncbi:hypothetical protein OKW21_001587 [Catalinimonas alkaloidigena]|uniref:hypothetical protein n=1 Tax=Catalinimonas alkaloidigena TaxID=1075417 RepID=UPI002405828E|nr:hypothetical protein [Catalinimonas alkaloidigena]MDF9796324.1 hypothetical protein [Catalinimonas alkaloidigena]